MKKLTLDLGTLRVQSFDTSALAAGESGTVRGHAEAGAIGATLVTCNRRTDPCLCDPLVSSPRTCLC